MSLAVEFLSGADADLQHIFNYLEDYQDGLGLEFLMAVDAYLARISTFPHIAPVYFENTRRQVMLGFLVAFFMNLLLRGFLCWQSLICVRTLRGFAPG